MSAPTPPPPAVIGSGKPHTVSVKPGTNVASSQKARKPDDEAGQDLTARLKATLRRGEEASQARRGTREPDAPKPAQIAQEPSGNASRSCENAMKPWAKNSIAYPLRGNALAESRRDP